MNIDNDNDDDINLFFDRLEYKLDDQDPNVQEEYYKILDKIIDATILLKYDNERMKLAFSSINHIDEIVLCTFRKINDDNKDYLLNSLTTKIAIATGVKKGQDFYYEVLNSVNKLYDLYKKSKDTLSYNFTTDFYNNILNRQQDSFMQMQKEKTKDILSFKLKLTEKKKNTLIRSAKLKKALELLSDRDFNALGMEQEELDNHLNELHIHLNKIKPFVKKEYPITDSQFQTFDRLFLEGALTEERLIQIYPEFKLDEVKIILNKYHQLLLQHIDNIEINESNLDYSTVDFNYNHVQIVNKERYYGNLKDLIENMNDDEIHFILHNFDEVKDLFKLLPLTNILEEFSTDDLKMILLNYAKIKNYLIMSGRVSEDVKLNEILNNFYEVIKLAKAYHSADKYTTAILKEENISKILQEKQTSRNPYDYVDAYIKMLNSTITKVPPISGEVNGYKFESGNNYDLERLFIGKNCYGSCVGPKGVGEEAYYAALTSDKADVLLITKDDNFVARIILFRRGNFIIMAPIHGQKGLNKTLYDNTFLSMVSSHLLGEAIVKRDNLDYIFLTDDYTNLLEDYPVIESNLFKCDLPHCDLEANAYLIGERNSNHILNLDEADTKCYLKNRKNVEIKDKGFLDDILKIKALEIFMERDLKKKEQLKERFDLVSEYGYEKLYVGQDWYIALKKDNTLERVVLPTKDDRKQDEIEFVKKDILGEKSSLDLKIEKEGKNKNI